MTTTDDTKFYKNTDSYTDNVTNDSASLVITQKDSKHVTKQTIATFKKDLLAACHEHHLPMQNKAILYYTLANQLLEQPDNIELHNLLVTALCGRNFLLTPYTEETSNYKYEKKYYKQIQKRITRLNNAIAKDRELPELWTAIVTHSKLPKVSSRLITSETIYEEETKYLTNAFCDAFEVSEKDCPELYYNLYNFVCITMSDAAYRSIAPLFFSQLMLRHKHRLAHKQCLNISAASLWTYKMYEVYQDNEKNFKMYNNYFYIFRTLCKYYKNHNDVNINLAKYGFQQCSNITDWVAFVAPKLTKKCMTKAQRLFQKYVYVDYWECEEPKEFCPYASYDIDDNKDTYFFMKYRNLYNDIENCMMDYLAEHIDYIDNCMQYMYKDASAIHAMVQEIYHNAKLENNYPKEMPLNYRLSNVYSVLIDCLNHRVEETVKSALLCQATKNNRH